jgi:hypothetical protein
VELRLRAAEVNRTDRFPLQVVVLLALGVACRERTGAEPAQAQNSERPPPTITQECSRAEFRQFDFWIGEWNVHFPDGRPAGINRITQEIGGCAIHERWTSATPPFVGESFNTYRQDRRLWHQTWIDNQGGMLLLDGEFAGGVMRLAGISLDSTGAEVRNRITWTPMDSAGYRVRQVWETSRDGKTWSTDFDGFYVRRPNGREGG